MSSDMSRAIVAAICIAVFTCIYQRVHEPVVDNTKLKYWPVAIHKRVSYDHNMRTIMKAFDVMDWQKVNGLNTDWDILWSVEYVFFHYPNKTKNLKPHQRINHFPGMSYIVDKRFMVTHNQFDFIPPAFQFPKQRKEFETYVKEHPKEMFVEKNNTNRGVKIVKLDDIQYNDPKVFYQVYVGNPLLIDGVLFDFGVYVVVTSINPLRIYRYYGEGLVRFCPEPYYPFDPKNIKKYVIDGQHDYLQKLPTLKPYYDILGHSYIDTLEHFLVMDGRNVTDLWRQVDDAIVTLTHKNEENIIKLTKKYASPRHFFELLRFDFIINNDFKVHLMEVNMSPNLTPSDKEDELNALGYEQIVYSTLKLVGAENRHNYMFEFEDENYSRMMSHFQNVAVDIDICAKEICILSCESVECSHCKICINSSNMKDMLRAYQEHIRKGDMKRIFPTEIHYNEEFIKDLSPANAFSTKWFMKKCRIDKSYC